MRTRKDGKLSCDVVLTVVLSYYNWGGAGGPLGDSGSDINSHIWFTCQGDGGKIAQDAQQFSTSHSSLMFLPPSTD